MTPESTKLMKLNYACLVDHLKKNKTIFYNPIFCTFRNTIKKTEKPAFYLCCADLGAPESMGKKV
jgi:hypothetical protein